MDSEAELFKKAISGNLREELFFFKFNILSGNQEVMLREGVNNMRIAKAVNIGRKKITTEMLLKRIFVETSLELH